MATDTQYKQFLAENSVWVGSYLPLVKELRDEYAAKNVGKPVPSLAFILATIKQESGGNTWGTRFEPGFNTWLKSRIKQEPSILKTFGPCSRETEVSLRSTSFGLMQLMGQTLRELGYSKTFLTEACDPRDNISYGIKYLGRLLDKYKDEDAASAAYNAGSAKRNASGKFFNQEYVDSVKRFKTNWQYLLDKGWVA